MFGQSKIETRFGHARRIAWSEVAKLAENATAR
jgi:hypothetical protein